MIIRFALGSTNFVIRNRADLLNLTSQCTDKAQYVSVSNIDYVIQIPGRVNFRRVIQLHP